MLHLSKVLGCRTAATLTAVIEQEVRYLRPHFITERYSRLHSHLHFMSQNGNVLPFCPTRPRDAAVRPARYSHARDFVFGYPHIGRPKRLWVDTAGALKFVASVMAVGPGHLQEVPGVWSLLVQRSFPDL